MVRLALCQINSTVGDIAANLELITAAARQAAEMRADLAVFPEMAISGYPAEDLLLKPRFVKACREALFNPELQLPVRCLVGMPLKDDVDGLLYNSAAVLKTGVPDAVYRKVLLPNYAVFDEKRYFAPGGSGLVLAAGKNRLGVIICEDIWDLDGPARDEAAAGADTIICLSASPFHRDKVSMREEAFARLCRKYKVNLAYCNLVGAQDELVFDGASLFMDRTGKVLTRGNMFREEIFYIDLPEPDLETRSPRQASKPGANLRPVEVVSIQIEEKKCPPLEAITPRTLSPEAAIYECLVLGVRDYVRKNGFAKVAIGLSGGIDSALSTCIAVDALGRENVTGVTMPGQYSSGATRADAEKLAENLGIRLLTIPIDSAFKAFLEGLAPSFAGLKPGLAEENIQARIRAVYLMALSNKFGWLVLNTSNKSEAAVGYGTMYGDMIGGYSVLKDVLKTTVYKLSWHLNKIHGREIIPKSTITRAPSAELRPGQKDSDSLPEYDILDPILEAYIEKDLSIDEMIAAGFDEATVRHIVDLVDRNEWKRRQSVTGVRVTPKAFGKDRRFPITNHYRG